MKIYSNQTVLEATKKRLNWIFDEFPNVVVSVSGGKDSTVVFELSYEIAKERGRLPLRVFFIDQEAEWGATIEQIQSIMYREGVDPYWMQVPMVLFNATSHQDHWLKCWDPDKRALWIHPQDPISKKENIYGTDRFEHMFKEVFRVEFGDTPTANIGGVRAQESPTRMTSLTYLPKYKWVTWGKKFYAQLGHYTFYPIYDWGYTDVWKAIYEHGWNYNKIYDLQYQYGVGLNDMKVSNVHHETAVQNLFNVQEM